MSPELSASPTMAAATRTGIIMGTAAFMSPEQARGKQIDKRTDIWAFGCVLFEMLTGRRAFAGETITDILAAIVHQEPALEALPPETPQRIRELLKRCLQKASEHRLRDIGEARIAVEAYLADPEGEKARALGAGGATTGGRLRPWRSAAAVVLAVLIAVTAWFVGRSSGTAPAEHGTRRFDLGVSIDRTSDARAQISPDGRKVVYTSDGVLWLRELDALEGRPLPGTEDAILAFWSPDSREVAFGRDNIVWRLPIDGGQPTRITEVREFEGGVWVSPDRMVIGADPDVAEVAARGGDPQIIVAADRSTEGDLHVESALPGGRGILFRPHSGANRFSLVLWDGEARQVLIDPEESQYVGDATYSSSSGHLLYTRVGGNNPGVWARPFSLDTLKFTGEAVLVAPGGGNASVSEDGTLLYVDGYGGGLRGAMQLTWVDREGNIKGTIGQPQLAYRPELAADQQRVAVIGGELDTTSVWIQDSRGSRSRVSAADARPGDSPAWLPGTNEILYAQMPGPDDGFRERIVATSLDGVGVPRLITEGFAPMVSADGTMMVFLRTAEQRTAGGSPNSDIWYLELDREGAEPQPFLQTEAAEFVPRLSPDGELLAYASFLWDGGAPEIHVRPFPKGTGRAVVSVNGGVQPRWSADGRELFFLGADRRTMLVAGLEDAETLTFAPPVRLFEIASVEPRFGYDVGADGSFVFVGAAGDGQSGERRLVLVENWARELDQGGR
jgi:Tol biopolymer transport system component